MPGGESSIVPLVGRSTDNCGTTCHSRGKPLRLGSTYSRGSTQNNKYLGIGVCPYVTRVCLHVCACVCVRVCVRVSVCTCQTGKKEAATGKTCVQECL